MDDNREGLAKYRLSEAQRCLMDAQIAIDNEGYKTAANRSYYAMFHSLRALLALESVDYKRHSAVIAHFRKEYVKKGIFDKAYSDYIGQAFEVRGKSDYDDFYIVSKEEVVSQLQNAEALYEVVFSFFQNHQREKD